MAGNFDLTSMARYGMGDSLLPPAGVLPYSPSFSTDVGTPGALASPTGGGIFGDFFGGMLGSRDAQGNTTPGWGGLALGAFNGISGFLDAKAQRGLMEDSLKEQRRQFNLNYEAQRKTTNTALEDRQRARVASNPNAYVSVGDYMDKNRI